MSAVPPFESGLRQRILELLEEIEATTCEIHCRTLEGGALAAGVADEATRIAAEGEQLVARRLDHDPVRLMASLERRRSLLRGLLRDAQA